MEKFLQRLDDWLHNTNPYIIYPPKNTEHLKAPPVSESRRDEDPPYYEKQSNKNYKRKLQRATASKEKLLMNNSCATP